MNQPYSSESNSTNLTASSFKYENNNNSNFNIIDKFKHKSTGWQIKHV